MPSTASNARALRRTETGVPRLSISEVRERIYSTKRKVFEINDRPLRLLRGWLGVLFIQWKGDFAQARRSYKRPV